MDLIDEQLNRPISGIPSTSEMLRGREPGYNYIAPWEKLETLLEYPVREPCRQLYELGICTTGSSANHSNAEKEDARFAFIGIDFKSLAWPNQKSFRALAASDKEHCWIGDWSGTGEMVELRVPLPGGDITGREVQQAFVQLIGRAGLVPQPAFWLDDYNDATRAADTGRTEENWSEGAAVAGYYYDSATQKIFPNEQLRDYYVRMEAQAAEGTRTRVGVNDSGRGMGAAARPVRDAATPPEAAE